MTIATTYVFACLLFSTTNIDLVSPDANYPSGDWFESYGSFIALDFMHLVPIKAVLGRNTKDDSESLAGHASSSVCHTYRHTKYCGTAKFLYIHIQLLDTSSYGIHAR